MKPVWSAPRLILLQRTATAANAPELQPDVDSTLPGGTPVGFSSAS